MKRVNSFEAQRYKVDVANGTYLAQSPRTSADLGRTPPSKERVTSPSHDSLEERAARDLM